MAIHCIFCALVALLFLMPDIHATSVEVTVPVKPVIVGGVLAIQCKIRNMKKDHEIRMYRVANTHTEQLTSRLIYMGSSLGQRIFLARRNMPGGITVFFTTIVDISMLDEGEYLCRVYTLSGRDHVKVTEDSADVEIYSLPNSIYPQCQSTPTAVVSMNENVPLTLACISAKGNPAVELRWIDNLNQEISSESIIQDNTVSAELTLRTSTRHSSIFICEMTSPGFPDFKRTCEIGPVTIKTEKITVKTAVIQPNIEVVPPKTNNQKTPTSNGCARECPDDKYTILYLTMATVGTVMLTIVFLITTIIMCFKYNNASNDSRNVQRNITSNDGSEPVYVSLQRRPELERSSLYSAPERRSLYKEPERILINREPERSSIHGETDKSSTYMSVEDPNNPGSKVLMPKEVFEEFYNSLSLKKI